MSGYCIPGTVLGAENIGENRADPVTVFVDLTFKWRRKREFPGGPVVKTQRFHCGVQFLVGEQRSHEPRGQKRNGAKRE